MSRNNKDAKQRDHKNTVLIRGIVMTLAAIVIALACFIGFAATQGAGIGKLYAALYYGVLANPNFLSQTLVKAVPLVCATLAVIIPARAGLVNVGGEGQLIIGAVAGTGMAVTLNNSGLGWIGAVMAMAAGALAGGVWGYCCALLKTALHAPEAVTTLLANFIATDIMLYLLYSSWKDPDGSGQPQSRPISTSLRLGSIGPLPIAFLIAMVACALVWVLLNHLP